MMKNKIHLFLIILIFVMGFFLRFYKLGEVPSGLEQDETSIGYNAYNVLKTGKDQYGAFLPISFKAFGEYKLPLYIYSAVVPVKFFGLTEFAVRFPSALAGSLTIVLLYFFLKQLLPKEQSALIIVASFLLAINPWHLHFSRGAFEVTLALFFILSGVYFFLLSLKKEKRFLLLFSILFLIASLYTYNIARVFTPLLGIFLFWKYKKEMFSDSKQVSFLSLGLVIILLLPFASQFFSRAGVQATLSTLLFSSAFSKAPLLEFRSYLIEFPQIFVKLFFNMFIMTIWQYLGNITSYFSIPFFFVSGSSHGNHGIGNVGQFYIFEFPLIIIGLVKIIRERIKWGIFFLFWAVLVIFIASLTREAPHATRSFFLIVPLELFSALGLLSLWGLRGEIKKVFFLAFGVFILYNLLYYFVSYYVRFPIFYARAWRSEDKSLSLYIRENQDKYDKIIFDKKAGFIYTSLLFYFQYPPGEFQKSVVWAPDDSEGFSEVLSFGKYEFRDIDWFKDYVANKTLLITALDKKPKETPSFKSFSYPKRPVVISVKQEIIQYPVEESAYVLVESKGQK